MAYVVPTEADFRARFPIFQDAEPEPIIRALAEATSEVDTTWREADYAPAILYLAAHLYSTDNSEEGGEVELGGVTGSIASESFSGMSISYASRASGSLSNSDRYGSTEYGRRYLALLRRNCGGPIVV